MVDNGTCKAAQLTTANMISVFIFNKQIHPVQKYFDGNLLMHGYSLPLKPRDNWLMNWDFF